MPNVTVNVLTVAIDGLLKMGTTVTDFHRVFCRLTCFKNPFRMDVAVSVCCGLDCMNVAVMVCRRFGLSPFQPVAVLTVAISVCRRFDCTPRRHVCQSR